MPRSSESVAALASALAKAQAELVNPEKSLTATIRDGRAGEGGERSFRYAPLSSGLDIVRKTLGRHEIATMQTTAIDQAAGLVNLTTMLAHASGEWIASDWPVCAIADMASPRRMGAALTYARRYALFTLVGIAGEDDLDAPDLQDGANTQSGGPTNGAGATATAAAEASLSVELRLASNGRYGRARGAPSRTAPVVLTADQSAVLRDRLMSEVAGISSAEQAASWARGALASKNSLTTPDATILEAAFERKLFELSPVGTVTEPETEGSVDDQPAELLPSGAAVAMGPVAMGTVAVVAGVVTNRGPPPGIDKSVLALPEPKRYRNREHLRFVAQQACLICARKPSDPHHLRFTQSRALGRKVSDEFTVPLCRTHHRSLHRVGDERSWWKATGIEPVKVARKLWRQTRLLDGQAPAQVSLEQARPAWRPQPKDLAAKLIDAEALRCEQGVPGHSGDGRTP